MAVLMEGYSEDGHHRVCNAHCHTAQGQVCRCICGGKNHGMYLCIPLMKSEPDGEQLKIFTGSWDEAKNF